MLGNEAAMKRNLTNQSQLLAFVYCINQDQIVNQCRFCKELSGSAKGVDVFNILHCYLNASHSMVDCFMGLISVEDVIVTHCFLHSKALIAKALRKKFRKDLEQVVQMVNFIKTRPVETRFFEKLCIDMQSEHRRLLLHKELVRSMCINKILAIVVECLISLEETLSSFFPSFNTERLDLKPIHGNFLVLVVHHQNDIGLVNNHYNLKYMEILTALLLSMIHKLFNACVSLHSFSCLSSWQDRRQHGSRQSYLDDNRAS
ncbi:protein ZBED8-like [Schistocerca gregaria]|uniref:protein ZBED8-like n=1 Tax=Schistocerca gregaria TaxID=7010 RepID=UPI00211EC7E9|nr:protein ZBED8-like [Schistocerca gregaria]